MLVVNVSQITALGFTSIVDGITEARKHAEPAGYDSALGLI